LSYCRCYLIWMQGGIVRFAVRTTAILARIYYYMV
jgi:hypothetical protein